MAGTTRPQPRELRRPAVRGSTRTRIPQSQDRAETPAVITRSVAPSRNQKSPTAQSHDVLKRRERELETPSSLNSTVSDTSIRVIVRSRGRNEREVNENSGVVVATDGVKGSIVELSMGPNALSNKTYEFDKVFSSAADQAIVFDEAVTPILNEMLAGYNCTIFAYGQTGTGKTYTMTGDMTDTLGLLSDNAGIIPRVLYALFQNLEDRDCSVKCSFLELYNEDLRDLLSSEEGPKLKIYEEGVKKGYQGTMVQGMGESFIHSATEGIKLLKQGSDKRHVAATKCNDLSSRSHTIFTITAFIKRTNDKGEEVISSGKLNLVDLAGSENIQRSGAENKRAAEAGLINKSLLTLGRVINALVDKSPHIPYRESKLTRLLQDSLGGHTKTCIIATVSPARSNLEETISTLDYAFRAKNIRNKPQINSAISKKMLLREWTMGIEKLKSELIATRQRNGVYLPVETYEEMTMESESHRILIEEQRAKIETMDANLKHKVQEVFTLTGNFNNLKSENEAYQAKIEDTEDILQKTEIFLQETRRIMEDEATVREAHEATEAQLHGIGTGLLSTLENSVSDITGLHASLQRRSDLHHLNREKWDSSNGHIIDVVKMLDQRVATFQSEQGQLIADLSSKMHTFVAKEQHDLEFGDTMIKQMEASFDSIQEEAKHRLSQDRDSMNDVLEEIKVLRENVMQKVSEGLGGLSNAAAKISDDVIHELEKFHVELSSIYHYLSDDFSKLFRGLAGFANSQKDEIDRLRKELHEANRKALQADEEAAAKLEAAFEDERNEIEAERVQVMAQVGSLLNGLGERQATRMKDKVQKVQGDMHTSRSAMHEADKKFGQGVDEWTQDQDKFVENISEYEKGLSSRIDKDLSHLTLLNHSIVSATGAVHEKTVRIVEEQKEDMDIQMQALDGFVTRARYHNDMHHDSNVRTLSTLADKVGDAHTEVRRYLHEVKEQSKGFECQAKERSSSLQTSVNGLTGTLKRPLSELKSDVRDTSMVDYAPTGQTPKKVRYDYPTALPRTESREKLLARSQPPTTPSHSSRNTSPSTSSSAPPIDSHSHTPSPTKGPVYGDSGDEEVSSRSIASTPPARCRLPTPRPVSSKKRLREVDTNAISSPPPLDRVSDSPGLASAAAAPAPPGSENTSPIKIKEESKDDGLTRPPSDMGLPPAKRRASLAKVTNYGTRLAQSKAQAGKKVVRRTTTRESGLPAPTRVGGRRLRRENPS